MLEDEIRRYLGSHTVMTIATTGENGAHAAAVYYAADERFRLCFLTHTETAHGRHMLDRPQVAATIQEHPFDWIDIRGLQILADAFVLHGSEASAARATFVARYPYTEDMLPDRHDDPNEAGMRLWWLQPRSIRLIDNRKGFGHKEELHFDREGRPVPAGG